MTDGEIISRSLTAVGAGGGEVFLVKKSGRVLLALPHEKEAALVALRLYQPQRVVAKVFVWFVAFAFQLGLQRFFLRRVSVAATSLEKGEEMPKIDQGTAGVLIGNPDHLIRRAIISFRGKNGFEVAKVAFGKEGVDLIDGEAGKIISLPKNLSGIPTVLGIHHRDDVGVMRMPHFRGQFLDARDEEAYITLLTGWLLAESSCVLGDFPEWETIERVLSTRSNGMAVLEGLKCLRLRPAVRHGDFAPWNLIRDERGEILALDWEWGEPRGVPGFDLIHYLTQDLRLVQRLNPSEVVAGVEEALEKDLFSQYLKQTGWDGAHRKLFIAAMAFSMGSGMAGLEEILESLLSR